MTATAVPTSTNATARPARRLRRISRLALVVVAGAVLLGSTACSPREAGFIEKTNTTRSRVGARPLEGNLALWLKAGAWTIKMAGNQRLAHSNLPEGNPYQWRALGENVGVGPTLDSIYNALLNSPGHYNNIVNPSFGHIGVGIYFDGSRYWVAQEFMTL